MGKEVFLGVKNYGPLRDGTSGLEKGLMSFPKYSVLIGDQGTGKSTIAKLFSTLSWLEKALIRKYYDVKSFGIEDLISLLKTQNLPGSYVQNSTEIEFRGQIYDFSVTKKKLRIVERIQAEYLCPQIMYFPSERNILGSISNPWGSVRNFPEMVSQLAEEYLNASLKAGRRKRQLFSEYLIQFDPDSKKSFIIDKKEKSVVSISNASSGLQSLTPLIVVSEYLVDSLKEEFLDRLRKERFSLARVNVDSNLDELLSLKLSSFFSSGIKKYFDEKDISILEKQLGRYVNSCLWEIVEEPEQNLYPTSQVSILRNLIGYINSKGKLVMTTHSPYILSAMNNFIFAKEQFEKYGKRVLEITPKLMIDYDDVSTYKIQNGSVRSIMDYESRMIDVTEIDECSAKINHIFDKLFDIGG